MSLKCNAGFRLNYICWHCHLSDTFIFVVAATAAIDYQGKVNKTAGMRQAPGDNRQVIISLHWSVKLAYFNCTQASSFWFSALLSSVTLSLFHRRLKTAQSSSSYHWLLVLTHRTDPSLVLPTTDSWCSPTGLPSSTEAVAVYFGFLRLVVSLF